MLPPRIFYSINFSLFAYCGLPDHLTHKLPAPPKIWGRMLRPKDRSWDQHQYAPNWKSDVLKFPTCDAMWCFKICLGVMNMDVPLDELWYAFFKKSDDVYWYWMVLVCCIFDFDYIYIYVSKNALGVNFQSILRSNSEASSKCSILLRGSQGGP